MEKKGKKIRRLFYPPRCPGCDGILEPEEYQRGFCRDCGWRVATAAEGFCMKCGKALPKEDQEYCSDCRRMRHCFREGRGVYVYQGPMKNAMYRFKYANRRSYAEVFAGEAERVCGEWVRNRGIEKIIPVPLYWKKRLRRGYNQAFVWAKALEGQWGIRAEERSLLRLRSTRPQKELDPVERAENLRNAFYAKRERVEGENILLVDDIYTTGSTMDAAAGTLKEAGAKEVYCLCVCTGRDGEN